MYICKSCLEKSRHPGNWLSSLCGLKMIQSDKKQREIAKIKIAGNIRLTSKVIFFVAIVIEIFPGKIYIYVYVFIYTIFSFSIIMSPMSKILQALYLSTYQVYAYC